MIGFITPQGDAWCIDCAQAVANSDPIGSDTESDTPTNCRDCETLIQHALTDEGYRYVRDAIMDFFSARFMSNEVAGRACILRGWWEAYGPEAFDFTSEHPGDEIAGMFLEDFFKGVPTVDKYSPRLALDMAKIHGIYPHRWIVIDMQLAVARGPFSSLGIAAEVANIIRSNGQNAMTAPIYGPGETP